MSEFDMAALMAELRTDEGTRTRPYLDTATPPRVTIGTGRNLSDVGVSPDEIDLMLRNDIARAGAGLDRIAPWWRILPAAQARVMLNLCFNLGTKGLGEFIHFLGAMRAGDWTEAQAQLRDSGWYGQVGSRGPRMCARLGTSRDGAPSGATPGTTGV